MVGYKSCCCLRRRTGRPCFLFWADDFDHNRKPDVISGGNFYGVTPYEGRYDASLGSVLLQENDGWKVPMPLQLGLALDGEVRDVKGLKTIGGKSLYAIARNNNSIIFYKTSIK